MVGAEKEMKATIMKRSHCVLMLTRTWECLSTFVIWENSCYFMCSNMNTKVILCLFYSIMFL